MKRKPSSFKQQYVRILLSGPGSPADYPLALELINGGYAQGNAIISHGRDTHGQIQHLIWGGINTQGRVFADELQQQIDAASFRSKLLRVILVVSGFVAGALVQFFAALIGRA